MHDKQTAISDDIEEIFRKYKNKIYWLAFGITKNESDAEDVLQNVILNVMQNIDRFRGEAALTTWIYRIAYNESLKSLKRKYRFVKVADYINKETQEIISGLFINWPTLPDESMVEDEMKSRINETIRRMPIKYRMPLLLHQMERMPLKDIAAVLGLNVNSLKTRLHRTYLLLKSQIEAYEKDKEGPAQTDDRCLAVKNFVYDYIEETMDGDNRVSFEAHIRDCVPCKSFMDTYSKAIRITKALECSDIPEELTQKIGEFIAERASRTHERQKTEARR